MNPKYKFWQDSLAGLSPPMSADDPQCGFYRVRRGDIWVPVAVWPLPNAGFGFKIGREIVNTNTGIAQWHWYAENPITEAEYRRVAEDGLDWSDADPVVAALIAKPSEVVEMREKIVAAAAGVPAYAKIESDEADVRALSLRNLLNELASGADKAREAEKAPHLKAGREIDAKYKPLIDQARDAAGKIKKARDDWQDAKRAAAKAAAIAAEAATRAQEEASAHLDVSQLPLEPVKPVSNLPPPSATVKPAYGRASSTGTKMVVTAIDFDKMIAALKPRPEWPTLEEFLRDMAQKLTNRGIILDGVTAEERSNTR